MFFFGTHFGVAYSELVRRGGAKGPKVGP
jgi:hypothetical protein